MISQECFIFGIREEKKLFLFYMIVRLIRTHRHTCICIIWRNRERKKQELCYIFHFHIFQHWADVSVEILHFISDAHNDLYIHKAIEMAEVAPSAPYFIHQLCIRICYVFSVVYIYIYRDSYILRLTFARSFGAGYFLSVSMNAWCVFGLNNGKF